MSFFQGPFRPNASNPMQLFLDEYSWNREANVIWLESPAGVGFSYSKNPDDYNNVSDARTANDAYAFLQTFFLELFPHYSTNAFYITGESYGGILTHFCCIGFSISFQGTIVRPLPSASSMETREAVVPSSTFAECLKVWCFFRDQEKEF
jgi:hypothetical protein